MLLNFFLVCVCRQALSGAVAALVPWAVGAEGDVFLFSFFIPFLSRSLGVRVFFSSLAHVMHECEFLAQVWNPSAEVAWTASTEM